MATLTVQTLADPLADSWDYVAASGGGDVVPNDAGGVYIYIYNGDASAKTVTIKSYAPAAQAAQGYQKSDKSISVAAGRGARIGSLNASAWNNGLKQIELTYSAVTNLKVAAVKGS